MAVTRVQIRSGAYYDSVVLMQLQRSLAGLPGVLDAGVVMGTDANKDILAQSDLLTPEAQAAVADDLLVVVRAEDEGAAQAALGQVDEYESDETSIRILQNVWKATSAGYKQSTGDALMGPQPMDIVYVALFMQSLSDAMKKLTGRATKPALLSSHPASHARADRGLRVIIANQYAGHQLAKAAYSLLILRQGG